MFISSELVRNLLQSLHSAQTAVTALLTRTEGNTASSLLIPVTLADCLYSIHNDEEICVSTFTTARTFYRAPLMVLGKRTIGDTVSFSSIGSQFSLSDAADYVLLDSSRIF